MALYPSKITVIFTSIPTEIRKMGINSAFPINSILFISAELCGINLFKANPAANAPIIGSIPPISAKKPAKKTMKTTKI